MSKITEVAELVEKGKAKLVGAAVQSALDEGCEATEILNSMIDAMAVVGERFKNGEIFVPEMLVDEARDLLRDLHDIGKNLVAMMIESAGFEVIDLGVDVPASKVIECYKENPDVKVIALSALLTTTMPALKDTVAALNAEDFRSNVKIMVGGAPITKEFADEIGADGYSEDAASAAVLAKALAA